MVYNSYFANIIARLVFLLGSFIGLAYLLVHTSRFFTILFLLALSIIQVIALITFLNKTNRNLARFLLLLAEEDTSVLVWKDRVEHTFQGLHHSFKKVNEEISRIRMEKEEGSILLQNTVDQLQTGILVLSEKGEIELANDHVLKIFGLKDIKALEDLDRVQAGLSQKLSGLRHDSGNILNIGSDGNDTLPVLVRVSALKLGGRHLKILSLQVIKNELEANEIESWQKLTRVLAHEISNSVTPISTLGSGIHRKLTQASKDRTGAMRLPANVATDLLQSAELIESRSNSLIEFTEHYKTFTRLPEPVPEAVEVSGLLDDLRLFFKDDLERLNIQFDITPADSNLNIWADRGLLEQAFINLIRNALEALVDQKDGMISFKANRSKGRIKIELIDNGPGIPEDIQPQVFIPFFTTKPSGTGIGMSIVRKIVIMSGGSIRFTSEPGEGTRFIIELPEA